jgi:hypothetical protein
VGLAAIVLAYPLTEERCRAIVADFATRRAGRDVGPTEEIRDQKDRLLRLDDTPTGRLGPSASSADPGLVLAVDIGTTAVKVEVVDTAAVSNCGASANTRREPQPG